jgi:hypothetical protein
MLPHREVHGRPPSDVTVAIGCGVLAELAVATTVVDLQSLRVIGDPDCRGWTSLDQEVQQTSTKPSTNTPRFSQTQGDAPDTKAALICGNRT